MKNIWISLTWSILSFVFAVIFGVLGKPTEMGIIVVAGAMNLAFLNIDKIQRFKGVGFEAEMKKVVEDANATIEQLRKVATTSSKATLTSLMAGNFAAGTNLEMHLKLHDLLIVNLKDIGVSKEQIDTADEMWKRGVGIIFHRGIKYALEENNKKNRVSPKASPEFKQTLKEFDSLSQFAYRWKAPSSDEIREFIEEKKLMSNEIDELLIDYKEYETNGRLRRRAVFVKL